MRLHLNRTVNYWYSWLFALVSGSFFLIFFLIFRTFCCFSRVFTLFDMTFHNLFPRISSHYFDFTSLSTYLPTFRYWVILMSLPPTFFSHASHIPPKYPIYPAALSVSLFFLSIESMPSIFLLISFYIANNTNRRSDPKWVLFEGFYFTLCVFHWFFQLHICLCVNHMGIASHVHSISSGYYYSYHSTLRWVFIFSLLSSSRILSLSPTHLSVFLKHAITLYVCVVAAFIAA